MEGKAGIYWLEKILEIDSTIIVFMITAYGDVDLAVTAIRKGAMDFVMKPWKNEKLLASVMSAIKLRVSKVEIEKSSYLPTIICLTATCSAFAE